MSWGLTASVSKLGSLFTTQRKLQVTSLFAVQNFCSAD